MTTINPFDDYKNPFEDEEDSISPLPPKSRATAGRMKRTHGKSARKNTHKNPFADTICETPPVVEEWREEQKPRRMPTIRTRTTTPSANTNPFEEYDKISSQKLEKTVNPFDDNDSTHDATPVPPRDSLQSNDKRNSSSNINPPTLGKSASRDGTPILRDWKQETIDRATSSPTGVWEYLGFSPSANNSVKNGSFDSDCPTIMSQVDLAPVPDRLIDFFCIVGPKLDAIVDFAATPSDVHVAPTLMDCYPKERSDMDFPKELPMFCLPHKCQLVTPYDMDSSVNEPTLSNFVLTSGNGNRLYGTVLTQYEVVPLEDLCQAFWAGNSTLPHWLEEPQPFYLPKCLVVFSHHALFGVQRAFLQQLHRIAVCGMSPLPLERYIASFLHDMPLPKPGNGSVSWRPFTRDVPAVNYRRPAQNELPLVNVSFRPLFRCLSVSNILTIWGILLQEGRVVLRSEHIALLTPVAEALISLLFPLSWQGVYVPVLPSTMMGVLEAPVPFLVGLLVGSNSCPQPPGVVVCDLDQDIVHLGTSDQGQPQKLPSLPTNLVSTLKSELDDVADPLYLIPPSGTKGRITTAVHGLMENEMREPYAHMFQMRNVSLSNTHRQSILFKSNFISRSMPSLHEDDFLVGPDEEQTLYKSVNPNKSKNHAPNSGNVVLKALRRQGRAIQAHADRAISHTSTGTAYYDEIMAKKKEKIAKTFFDDDENLAELVRFSFLRFFSSLFRRYKGFRQMSQGNVLTNFRHIDFVNSMEDEMSYENRLYILEVIQTQMFERFLVESSTRRRLFDEYILVHKNQEAGLMKKKHDTPFLKQQPQVQKIIVPASPCVAGVPKNTVFEYDHFPYALNKEQLVANKTLDPVSALCYLGDLVMRGSGNDDDF